MHMYWDISIGKTGVDTIHYRDINKIFLGKNIMLRA